jgi:hypothetical protein
MSRAGAVVCSMRKVPSGRRMSDAFITAPEKGLCPPPPPRPALCLDERRTSPPACRPSRSPPQAAQPDECNPRPPATGRSAPTGELAHRQGLRPHPRAAARLTIDQNRQSTPHQIERTTHVAIPVPPTHAREARLAAPAPGPGIEPYARRSQGVAARAQSGRCRTTGLRAVERILS